MAGKRKRKAGGEVKKRRRTRGSEEVYTAASGPSIATGSSGKHVDWKKFTFPEFERSSERGDYRDTGLQYRPNAKRYRQKQSWGEEPTQVFLAPNEINASNANFSFRVPKGKVYRPHMPDFVYLKYRVGIEKYSPMVPAAQDRAEVAAKWEKVINLDAINTKNHEMFWLNMPTAIADFISDLKIDVAGVNVVAAGTMKQQAIGDYVFIERVLCSKSVYEERMGKVESPIRNGNQFTRDGTKTKTPEQLYAQTALSFIDDASRRMLVGSIDGIFLFGQPSSPILKSMREYQGIRRDETDVQWIPPDTELRINVAFENPETLGRKIERGGDKAVDDNYFSDANQNYPQTEQFRLSVHIDDIHLNFECRNLTEKMDRTFNRGNVKLTYTWDAPYHFSKKHPGGMSDVYATFDVWAGTEIAYLCFKHAHQKNYMANMEKHTSHRCVKPANLDWIELKLNDRPLYEQKRNLQDLINLPGAMNATALNYYSSWRNKGLFPFPLETLFPASLTAERSYCFVLLVDLSLHRLNSLQTLHVHCRYNNDLSPPNFDIDFFGVKQQRVKQGITSNDRGAVQMSVLAPLDT